MTRLRCHLNGLAMPLLSETWILAWANVLRVRVLQAASAGPIWLDSKSIMRKGVGGMHISNNPDTLRPVNHQ